MRILVLALVLIMGLTACVAQGASPEHPVYTRCVD